MADHFWKNVPDRPVDGCWLWEGRVWKRYGAYAQPLGKRGSRRHMGAHRRAYELMVGPVPDGLELDHLCNTPRCVNPAHLEPVTGQENLRRGMLRRIGEADIVGMYESGMSLESVAEATGVTRSTVTYRLNQLGVEMRRPGRPRRVDAV